MKENDVLYVNLSTQTIRHETISHSVRRQYLGGNGFAIKYLYDLTIPGADPLSPENPIVFAVGPVNGTIIPGSAVSVVASRSPLTNRYIDSYMAGLWGTELKDTGCDVLIVQGKSEIPVYLYLKGREVEFRSAEALWGKMTQETEQAIKCELGNPSIQVAAIGPAGENLVKFATINHSTRAFGRGGMGAVMGAKKLKAIALNGLCGNYHANVKGILDYTRIAHKEMMAHPALGKAIPSLGSTPSVAGNNALGILGTRNWQEEFFTDAEIISGNSMEAKGMRVGHKACANCIARSAIIWEAKGCEFAGIRSRGPEYETLYSFGSVVSNNNVDSIVVADKLSDELGLDTISAGVTIAFLMECVEKGLIKQSDLDVENVQFGSYKAMLELLKKIAYREGIGDLLAEGTRAASKKVGQGSEKFAIHIKGLEIPGHTARGLKGMALGYATSPRGGSHQDFRPGPERGGKYDRTVIEGKPELVVRNQNMCTIGDSLILCRRHSEGFHGAFLNEKYVEIANLATGFDYDLKELTEVADRIFTLERLYNTREGSSRTDDMLPPRFLTEAIPHGPSKGMFVSREELDTMLNEYYKLRGWDPTTGIPLSETLIRLELPNV
jgi:aldehyde:ferredoxin oxidoreductase